MKQFNPWLGHFHFKVIGSMLLTLLFVISLHGQAEPFPDIPNPNNKPKVEPEPEKPVEETLEVVPEEAPIGPHFGIGISTGTKGFAGLDFAIQLNNRYNVRLGFNYLNFTLDNYVTDLNDRLSREIEVNGELDHTSIDLLGELAIAKGNIRFVAGAGFVFSNRIEGDIKLAENYKFNDAELTPDEVGSGGGSWTYDSNVSPYIGIAFGRLVAKKRLSFNLDLGAYYKGRPRINIVATGQLKENVRNGPILEENLSPYRWWPVMSIRLGYRIK